MRAPMPLVLNFSLIFTVNALLSGHIQLQRHSICIGMESHNASLQYYWSSNTKRARQSLHVQTENLI
jgi:hypothetical protein